MNWTFGLSVASLVFGVLIFVLSIAALGTPANDIGMVSTSIVFVLFGAFGLLLNKFQGEAAAN